MNAVVYERHGEGAPLVLLHGVGSRRQIWDPLIGRLAREHETIAVDLPGFGESPAHSTETAAFTVEAQAGRVERLFDELGIERPHVAGNSMGGAIALELARRHAVASATALSPAGFWTPRERTYAMASLRGSRALARAMGPSLRRTLAANPVTRTTMFAQVFARPWRMTPGDAVGSVEALVASEGFEPAMRAFERHTFGRAEQLRGVPVTVAWGDRDVLLLARRQSRRARRVLPWARHVTLRGCGHVPCSDDPQQVAAVLLDATRAPAA